MISRLKNHPRIISYRDRIWVALWSRPERKVLSLCIPGYGHIVRFLFFLGMSMSFLSGALSAAEINVGDEIVLKRDASLMLGRETLLKIDKGAKFTVGKVNGKFLQVKVKKEGKEIWGWIHSRCLEPETGNTLPTPSANNSSSGQSAKRFSAAEIRKLREKVQKLAFVPEKTPNGWSKSLVDPMKITAFFQPLRVNPKYRLMAYQFKEDLNGNGVVWAMPVGAKLPEPTDLLDGETNLFRAPKPGKALDNVMEAIEGDRSAKSFLLASILKREMDEFGAMWHGASWTVHVVLDADPWQGPAPADSDDPLNHPSRPASKWKWKTEKPTDWGPTVTVNGNVATVKFYTFCAIGKEGIYEHIDEYRPGEYRFSTERKKIAVGPMELAF